MGTTASASLRINIRIQNAVVEVIWHFPHFKRDDYDCLVSLCYLLSEMSVTVWYRYFVYCKR